VIKVGGEWLSSLEIEDVIAKHDGILEVAVIGAPDVTWGEVPLAIVIPKSEAAFDDREIVQIVKASVDSGVLPREAITMKVQRTDSIPKTSVGKVNKVELRSRFL
jgi:fatty-acyl-CoA synthase